MYGELRIMWNTMVFLNEEALMAKGTMYYNNAQHLN